MITLFGQILLSRTDDDSLPSPCVRSKRSKRPRVYRHHVHMLKHMCAWCRYTRGRFEWTLGVFQRVHHTPHRNNTTTTPFRDRDRERQSKKTEREEKTEEEIQSMQLQFLFFFFKKLLMQLQLLIFPNYSVLQLHFFTGSIST